MTPTRPLAIRRRVVTGLTVNVLRMLFTLTVHVPAFTRTVLTATLTTFDRASRKVKNVAAIQASELNTVWPCLYSRVLTRWRTMSASPMLQPRRHDFEVRPAVLARAFHFDFHAYIMPDGKGVGR